MSLYGSLFTGVSALAAQSQSLAMISNNIANVNTTGYKRNEASFSSIVTQSGQNTKYSPGGIVVSKQSTVNQGGIVQPSYSTAHAAIAGAGFFVVQQGTGNSRETFYTRDGTFDVDARGLLRTHGGTGYTVMGWPLDESGNIPSGSADLGSLVPVDITLLDGLAAPTTKIDLGANLDARQDLAAASPHFTRAITVYDSLGTPQSLELRFTKTATNEWTMETYAGTTLVGTQALEFDSHGTLTSPDPAEMTTPGIDWGNGSDTTQEITISLDGLAQFSEDFEVGYIDQDGAELGLRTGIGIDENGNVLASFSNGQTKALYRLPVATFTNANGLQEVSGNLYRQTQDSGAYNLREAGTSGAGLLAPASLEASNVDLADEFAKMIVTQRAYSAGTKIISTADQMLQELLQLR